MPHLFSVSTSELSSSDGENPILNGLPRRQFYRSHMLTLRSCSVNVGRLNSEVVRSMWASLSWELLYLTNDDDERYSIQVNADQSIYHLHPWQKRYSHLPLYDMK